MNEDNRSLAELWADWEQKGRAFWQEMDNLVEQLDGLLAESVKSDSSQ